MLAVDERLSRLTESWRTDSAEPNWEVALLFPPRGLWTADDYYSLHTRRRVELSGGNLEVLPMPTQSHELIVQFLFLALHAFVTAADLGRVLFAGIHVQLWPEKIRMPDVIFMKREHADRRHNDFWEGADLVMEVVSKADPARDLVVKREEYARAGIPEYWIVDPREETITVLTLDGDRYREHGLFRREESAASVLLAGFHVSVSEVFDAAQA